LNPDGLQNAELLDRLGEILKIVDVGSYVVADVDQLEWDVRERGACQE